jgi:hypothetical protein
MAAVLQDPEHGGHDGSGRVNAGPLNPADTTVPDRDLEVNISR